MDSILIDVRYRSQPFRNVDAENARPSLRMFSLRNERRQSDGDLSRNNDIRSNGEEYSVKRGRYQKGQDIKLTPVRLSARIGPRGPNR